MGWGRMLLLGNWGQQMDIEDQRKEIQRLKREMRRQVGADDGDGKRRIDALEAENDELKLYLVTLIRYLTNKGMIDSADFRELVHTIDSGDGAADGRYKGPIL